MSSVLSDLGNLHIVTGTISASGTAALTSNDGSATLTDNGTGDFTVTFGQPFLSAPTVVASVVDATSATTEGHVVAVAASATNSVQFNVLTLSQAAGTDATDLAAAADIDFGFVAVGLRNN